MNKIFTMLLAMGASCGALAQTECAPAQVITTAPGSAVNTQKPHLYNRFDWTQPSFPLRAEQLTSPTITSPFYQGPWNSNVSHLVDSKDRLPIDGWELINTDFGYNIDGTPASQKVVDPKLLLYNKYTGTFRLFFAKGRAASNDYNFVRIILTFQQVAGEYNFNTFTLANSGVLKALDASDYNSKPASFNFVQDFEQTQGNWLYADFPMHYDPCTCLFRSKIKVDVRFITNAQVNLTGTFTGQLAAITNGQGDVTNPPGFNANFPGQTNFLQPVQKAYKTIDGFVDDVKDYNEFFKSQADQDAFKNALKNNNFLKQLFASMPLLNVAVGFLDFFTAGGKAAGPQLVALTPTSIDLSGKITGTISNDVLNTSGVLNTPGSDPTGTDDSKYPAYNNPMGIITFTKTPRLKQYSSVIEQQWDGDEYYDVMRSDLVFDRSQTPLFEYALNPASGLRVKEVEAALVFKQYSYIGIQKPFPPNWYSLGYYDRSNNWTWHQTFEVDAFDYADSTIRYRTAYMPIDCFSGTVFQFESSNAEWWYVMKGVHLKVKFNLERIDGQGQNVFLVQTYDLLPGIVNLNWDQIRGVFPGHPSTANFNIKPEPVLNTCSNSGPNSNFQPASLASITAVCNSTTYRNKHINARTAVAEEPAKPEVPTAESGVIYPNPVTETVNLKTNYIVKLNQVALSDVTGRRVQPVRYDLNHVENGTLIKIDVKPLPAGVYFIQVQARGGKPATYKFVKQ